MTFSWYVTLALVVAAWYWSADRTRAELLGTYAASSSPTGAPPPSSVAMAVDQLTAALPSAGARPDWLHDDAVWSP